MPENKETQKPQMVFKYFIFVKEEPTKSEFIEAQTDYDVLDYITKKYGSTEAAEIFLKLF